MPIKGGDDSRGAYSGGDNTSQTVQQYHSLFIKVKVYTHYNYIKNPAFLTFVT